jgi:glycosyltransferase involved in cell wall biosynthesis
MNVGLLVSVIIPAYNAENYVAEAVESALGQSYRPLEVILVNDGSTDRTAGVAATFGEKIRYTCRTNGGIGAARNAGVRLAQGAFISFLDADDLWVADKVAIQVSLLRGDPSLDLVFGHVEQFHSPDLDDAIRRQIEIRQRVMAGYHAGTMLLRRKAFDRVGFFSERLDVGEFIDWYARAGDVGLRSFMCPEILMKRRLHKSNQGLAMRDRHPQYARLLKAALDRRRGG